MKYDEKEIHDKIKRKTRIKGFAKKIIYIILITTFVINTVLLFQNIFQKDGNKRFFNVYFFNIISR